MNPSLVSPMSLPPHPARRGACGSCATQGMCPLARLEPGLFAAVAPFVTERAFRRTDVLQRQGEAVDMLRVVKSGAVLLYRDGARQRGLPVAMAMAGPGQILGAVRLVDVPSVLTVAAAGDTRVCELATSDMERLGVLQAPAFHRAMAEAVFKTLGILADWARVARLAGARTRLAGALLVMEAQQKSERVRLPGHAVLGELLGVTRESVVRAMSALEAEGCITRLGRTYCELKPAALKDICDAA